MLRNKAIIFLLLISFLTPTGLSVTAHFMSSTGEGKLVMNLLSSTEEESSEQEKTEKEKEKQLSFIEFTPSSISPVKLNYTDSFLRFHLLPGDSEFPTPPPKFS